MKERERRGFHSHDLQVNGTQSCGAFCAGIRVHVLAASEYGTGLVI
jgi:hypothetical protein